MPFSTPTWYHRILNADRKQEQGPKTRSEGRLPHIQQTVYVTCGRDETRTRDGRDVVYRRVLMDGAER